MEEENTNTDIQKRRKYPKYTKPTTVRVHSSTGAFMQSMENMPLSTLVRCAPNWYERMKIAEEAVINFKSGMIQRDAAIYRLSVENADLLRFKEKVREDMKTKHKSILDGVTK